MADVFILFILFSAAMGTLSLIAPRVTLFFAAPPRRTRLWGFAFWHLATIASAGLFGLSTDTQASPTPAALKGFIGLAVAACLALAYKLRQGAAIQDRKAQAVMPSQPADAPNPATTIVASHTTAGENYSLDIAGLSCTCPDWAKRRADQAHGHPSRLCKHLTEYFSRKPVAIPQALRPYQGIIKERGTALRGMPVAGEDTEVEYGEVKGEAYVMDVDRNSFPWVNILTVGKRYGYNTEERRWARGNEPDHARTLAKKVRKLTGEA